MPYKPIPASKKKYLKDKDLRSGREYNSHRWRQDRKRFLRKNPLCVFCKQRGKIVAATVVDHIEPHKGDMKLFWNKSNWQGLCKTCHNSIKKRIENKE